ncbi:hypothetical protein J4H86_02285 [Spiractinospora alimapuensis]|uniref:hypothetical protein n=1 Tax=Spiractinospora alimapuensis TaxID=2820884 RepID=UPI001F1BFF14|nr:hypothetical protein [Spiractinospora alimapuensis]QVQ52681.1 hypothetical protein J4H86_02285 [Spiractinospora alimapuensis]
MSSTPTPLRGRLPLVLGLLALAPISAEYLSGYDDTTGDPLALLYGLLFLGPLYGGPAVLIREFARRRGLGWPSILVLGLAFGLVQAGMIDQSLFSTSYRDIEYWSDLVGPTFVEPLGTSAFGVMAFLVGHAVWSYCAPIAVMEGVWPGERDQPWLRAPGIILVTVAYLVAATAILTDHLRTESDHASLGQLLASALIVLALGVLASLLGRRRPTTPTQRQVPAPWLLALGAAIVALVFDLQPSTWTGVAGGGAALILTVVVITALSRSSQWTPAHGVALAAGALTGRAVLGFLAQPIGAVSAVAKYSHNTVLLALVLTLTAVAIHRSLSPFRSGRRPGSVD